jgi:hypothetical protein
MQDDFPDINPLLPSHYLYLARRCFAALVENNGKVRPPCLQCFMLISVKNCNSMEDVFLVTLL